MFRDQDLFHEKTMPLGDHLDELRTVLAQSLTGIAAGVLVGFFVAPTVVGWVEAPLRRALHDHYLEKSINTLADEFAQDVPQSVQEMIRREQVVYQKVFLEPGELEWVGLAAESGSSAHRLPDRLWPRGTLIATRVWLPVQTKIIGLHATEAFMMWLKASFACGLLIASPYVCWRIWSFVGAGLYRHERRVVYRYFPLSLLLWVAGACLAVFCVFPPVLDFLFSYNRALDIDPQPRISEWIGFVLFLPIGFGIAFQLPLVMVLLNHMGWVPLGTFLQRWRVAILGIFVASMILTPQEPISMLAMALPLVGLYFMGVIMCWWRRSKRAET